VIGCHARDLLLHRGARRDRWRCAAAAGQRKQAAPRPDNASHLPLLGPFLASLAAGAAGFLSSGFLSSGLSLGLFSSSVGSAPCCSNFGDVAALSDGRSGGV